MTYPQQPGDHGQFTPAPQYPQQGHYAPAAQPQNGLGTAGFVTGLIGLILFWVPLIGLVLAIIGVSLSGVGLAKANRGEANNKGLAIAGLVCGTVALVILLIAFLAYAAR
ncbi:DUF4190 domain-containing protein [Actinokineospora sp. HUAS TT18]|uniref:DUF4190 domain-containing protein n=1 Tax=Actinokineospora sp. HUAS TT18 TaxID=3447451 RepID=UPI003F526629